MTNSPELENLVKIGQLKRAPVDRDEIAGLVHSGNVRLSDAESAVLSLESRFDLVWRLLARCHGMRNKAEYEGLLEVDERLIKDLINAALEVRNALRAKYAD